MAKPKKFLNSVFEQFDSTDEVCSECFDAYDEDRDGVLNYDECSKLISDSLQSKTYSLTDDHKERIFSLLDEDKDGLICREDFRRCGYYWLKQCKSYYFLIQKNVGDFTNSQFNCPIVDPKTFLDQPVKTLKPVSAFIIIDVQNDFIDGSLSLQNCPAGHEGVEVVPVINHLLDTVPFDLVVYTKDWHPDNHISFIENVKQRPITTSCKIKAEEAKVYDTVEFDGPPRTEQKLWPKHCVNDTWGSELHPDLKIVEGAAYVNKGCHSEVDSYSAFWDNNKLTQTDLVRILAKHKVTDVYVCGVAYDVCVGFTAFHSLEHGFRTVLIDDACRGVDNDAIEQTKRKLVESGGIIVHSSKVKAIVNGEDRPSALGLQTAKNVALARELVNRGIVK